MKESENEDTNTVVTETLKEILEEKLIDIDIDRSHRIGRLKKDKQSRPIIKFDRYKDTGISITESPLKNECKC